ncbi:tubulin-folding cofactor E [Humulus lupulus]|uniref:tubulin-folding cofactor E n=1 Tax=Humulus lupulus TaxID=3486 RepID=UPI002B40E5EC|nr:tubulin-folding cofactor E [Humulus lupulus]
MQETEFRLGQRVHSAGDPWRIGTVKYLGPVQGYSGSWVGVDWDSGDGKHDGSINGVRYFQAKSERSGSFVRTHNLSSGISLIEALRLRYQGDTTKEEEDEMYVLSSSNKRVSIQLLGKEKIQDKLSRFEELTGASLSFLGVSSPGFSGDTGSLLPNIKELDLTGNLLSDWKDVGTICKELPMLTALNLSYNLMAPDIVGLPQLKSIRILVLNHTGVNWTKVEILKHSLPAIEELHLMGNSINTIDPPSSFTVQGFDSLRLLNLEDNCIADWKEIMKLSLLKSLEQLHLNKNNLSCISYSDDGRLHELSRSSESHEKTDKPFQNLCCLLLGNNNLEDLASIDALNFFPKLVDIRLSDNPVADPGRGGVPRFVLIARLAKVEVLNGSEVRPRERKESEIRYIRLVMSKMQGSPEDVQRLHPRFLELKKFHGIEDEKLSSSGTAGPQKMASGLLSIILKCVGASIGEKPLLTKKLPGTTTVGKLKILCESFFKLKSVKLKLYLQEEGSPLPILLDDEMASLLDVGVGNESTILVDEES